MDRERRVAESGSSQNNHGGTETTEMHRGHSAYLRALRASVVKGLRRENTLLLVLQNFKLYTTIQLPILRSIIWRNRHGLTIPV